jgi:hypothetical protein
MHEFAHDLSDRVAVGVAVLEDLQRRPAIQPVSPMMQGPEKTDLAIVAGKPANKAEQSAAESVERRAGTKGNANQQSKCRTQSRISVSQALERIRQAFAVNGKITGGLA